MLCIFWIFWLITSLNEFVPTKTAFRNHSPDKPLIIVDNTEGSFELKGVLLIYMTIFSGI